MQRSNSYFTWATFPCVALLALGCDANLNGFGGASASPSGEGSGEGEQIPRTDPFENSTPEVLSECDASELGGSGFRRLSGREYGNVVRTLLNVDIDTSGLPRDGVSVDGYDTDGASLRLGERDADLYYNTVSAAVDAAFAAGVDPFASCRVPGQDLVSCSDQIFPGFLRTAYRRPFTADMLAPLQALRGAQADPVEGLKDALIAALLSPRTLFLVLSKSTDVADVTSQLDSFQMAERLAFFLWSSPPDDELLTLAEQDLLLNTESLSVQTRRMIGDPRFLTFVDGFVMSWLGLNQWKDLTKDPSRYPSFNVDVMGDMVNETRRFVENNFLVERPISELLTSSESFLNQRLASYYGVPGTFTEDFSATALPSGREGLLNQGSILAVTGGVSEPSPVRRGLWVTRKITCTEPPPPPPNIPTLPEEVAAGLSPREALAAHRENPSCAGCHEYIDPLGLALENFDSVGLFRANYPDGTPIDATSEWRGTSFDGSTGLVDLVIGEDSFSACLGEHLSTYVLGHVPEKIDNCFVQAAAGRLKMGDQTFYQLVEEVVTSELFFKFRPTGASL